MRLSWPRDNDKKRAMIATLPPGVANRRQNRNLFFINTALRDIELYRSLSPQMQSLQPIPNLRQPQQEVNHADLVHYCEP